MADNPRINFDSSSKSAAESSAVVNGKFTIVSSSSSDDGAMYYDIDGKRHKVTEQAEKKLSEQIGAVSEDLSSHVGKVDNPHSVTKSQVGLGNVPNVATNNQTPTYTEAASLTDLTSGEKLNIAFGKIKKAVHELINHIARRDNPHEVTTSQIGAAADNHTHTLDDGSIIDGSTYVKMTKAERTLLENLPSIDGGSWIVDSALSDTSTHPVQNKKVKEALDTKADKTQTPLLSGGKIPETYMPDSYDEVIFGYYNGGKFYKTTSYTTSNLIPGKDGKLYVDYSTSRLYRYNTSTSSYTILSSTLALGVSHSQAFYGDQGQQAYEHSLISEGNPHGTSIYDLVFYTTCSTNASTKAKIATVSNDDFDLNKNPIVLVKFTNSNTATDPTLNINSTGAKPIYTNSGTAVGNIESSSWSDNTLVALRYDGTNYVIIGRQDIQTSINELPTTTLAYDTSGDEYVVVSGHDNQERFYRRPLSKIYDYIKAKTDTLYSDVGHKHSAADITSGTLTVARGGTGQSTLNGAANSLVGSLESSTTTELTDSSVFITNGTNSGNENKYYRRTAVKIWNYVKSKADTVYAALSHNHTVSEITDLFINTTADNIKMDGTRSAGTGTSVARANHVHPTDTSRAAAADVYTKSEIDTKINEVIAGGGEVNQNAFSFIKVGSSTISADSKTDTLELAEGSGISFLVDTANDKLTVSSVTAERLEKQLNVTKGTNPSSVVYTPYSFYYDKDGTGVANRVNGFGGYVGANGWTRFEILAYPNTTGNGEGSANYFRVGTKDNGDSFYEFKDSLAASNAVGGPYIKDKGTHINATSTSRKDLNDYTTPGTYYSSGESESQYIDNCPPQTSFGFKLYVVKGYTGNVTQYVSSSLGKLYSRGSNSQGTWSSWIAITESATTSSAGLMSAADKTKLNGIADGATKVIVDSSLSSTSTNPVQNKVIYNALSAKSASSHSHGNITNGGAVTTTGAIDIADGFVFSDADDNNKLKKTEPLTTAMILASVLYVNEGGSESAGGTGYKIEGLTSTGSWKAEKVGGDLLVAVYQSKVTTAITVSGASSTYSINLPDDFKNYENIYAHVIVDNSFLVCTGPTIGSSDLKFKICDFSGGTTTLGTSNYVKVIYVGVKKQSS